MTSTARRIISELEAEIEKLPEDEQERRVAAYLSDAKKREKDQADFEPYSSFTFLEESSLDLPADYSETYEDGPVCRGRNRSDLRGALCRQRGVAVRVIDDADLLIAAVALARGAVLVTGNVRHYDRIDGLDLEDWIRG